MIVIFGKHGCGLCDKAKEKMAILGQPYEFKDFDDAGSDWREHGFTGAMAEYSHKGTLPIISVDGVYMEYSAAMKAIRK